MTRLLLLITLLTPAMSSAQFTVTGLKGMVNVPTAEVLASRTMMVGMHTNNQDYFLLDYGPNRQQGNEYVSTISIGFIERLNITMMLTRIFGDPQQTVGSRSSIGDRSLQLTYLMIKERQYLPSIVINITDPLFSTSQYLAGNHLIATKKIMIGGAHQLKSSLGYGLPYLLVFEGQEKRRLSDKESNFLTGFFGGIQYVHVPTNLYCSLEYDGRTINVGIGTELWKKLAVQLYFQGFNRVGFGFNYTGFIR